jgi:hypothetical protein
MVDELMPLAATPEIAAGKEKRRLVSELLLRPLDANYPNSLSDLPSVFPS